jgi:hypothetical protein
VLGAVVYARLPGGSAAGLPDAAHRLLFVAGLHGALLVSGVALIATAAVISAPPLNRTLPRSPVPGRRGWV